MVGFQATDYPVMKPFDLFIRKSVCKRQHGRLVTHCRETLHRFSADPLRRGFGCNQVGKIRLQRLQFAHQAIVLGIGDRGLILNVIAVIVQCNFGSKFADPFFRFRPVHAR